MSLPAPENSFGQMTGLGRVVRGNNRIGPMRCDVVHEQAAKFGLPVNDHDLDAHAWNQPFIALRQRLLHADRGTGVVGLFGDVHVGHHRNWLHVWTWRRRNAPPPGHADNRE